MGLEYRGRIRKTVYEKNKQTEGYEKSKQNEKKIVKRHKEKIIWIEKVKKSTLIKNRLK